jgi:putative component of membrane protein insertase Oxa1/YidC/SpoIIIJ protein YidD
VKGQKYESARLLKVKIQFFLISRYLMNGCTYKDACSLVQYNFTDIPTFSLWVVILFDEVFKCGDGVKFFSLCWERRCNTLYRIL